MYSNLFHNNILLLSINIYFYYSYNNKYYSACEIDDVLIEVIHLKPRSRMKKLMKKSSDSYDPSMSMSQLNSSNNELMAAAEQSNITMSSHERTYTESEHIGEQIKVEFKKALANRRPST